ncbi:8791_t:CDS:2 [Entrophospora sp. SA101]|nr:8791_t:CDS:2 [Entrophospora sp. SA101]
MKVKEAWLCHLPLGLHQTNLNSNAEGEDPDSILEDDNDD